MVLATTSVSAAPNPVIVCRGILAFTVMIVPVPVAAAAIVSGVVIGATCSAVMPAPAAREDWTPVTVLYIPITLAPVLPVPPVPELPLAMPEPILAPAAPELPAPVEAMPDPLPPAPEVVVPAVAPVPPAPLVVLPPPPPAGGVVDEHPARSPKVTREVKRDWKRALRIGTPAPDATGSL